MEGLERAPLFGIHSSGILDTDAQLDPIRNGPIGTYRVEFHAPPLPNVPELWDFVQTGTVLTVSGPSYNATGTIDETTGGFVFDFGPGSLPWCDNDHLGGASQNNGLSFIAGYYHGETVVCGSFPNQYIGVRCLNTPTGPEDCVEAYALATERRDDAIGVLFDWTGLETT